MLRVADQVAELVFIHGDDLDSPDVVEVTPARFDELARAAGMQAETIRLVHVGGELQSVVKVGRRLVRIVAALAQQR
jgi:hypothetical protein